MVFTYLYFKEMDQEVPFSDRKLRLVRGEAKRLGMRLIDGLEQPGYAYGYLDFQAGELVSVSEISS